MTESRPTGGCLGVGGTGEVPGGSSLKGAQGNLGGYVLCFNSGDGFTEGIRMPEYQGAPKKDQRRFQV